MHVFDEVAAGVFVATSSRESTTSTAVVSGSDCVLIDPAWTPSELDLLARAASERGWHMTAGFATHAHYDHLLWHPDFGNVARWASRKTAALAAEHRNELWRALDAGTGYPGWYRDQFARVTALPGTQAPAPSGETIEAVVHDGHAPGHTALWLADRKVLIAGDMLSDTELPLPFDPDDLTAYARGLQVLAPYVRAADLLIPGHGSPTASPSCRLDADVAYLAGKFTGDRLSDTDPRVDLPDMQTVDRRIEALAAENPEALQYLPSA